MKNFKRILMLLLALTLLFSFVACNGECKHVDEDEDGICDECDEEITTDECEHVDDDEDGFCDDCDECMEHADEDEDGFCDTCDEEIEAGKPSGESITLISDGEIFFSLVLGSDIDKDTKIYIDEIEGIFEELEAPIDVLDDKKGNEKADIEILIGTVTSRGEDYEYKKTSLGMKGYAITAIDETKIVIAGGSEKTLLEAVKTFFEEYLGVDSRTKSLDDFSFGEDHEKVEVQSDYRVTDVTLGGESVKDGYVITVNKEHNETNTAAKAIQSALYEKAGIWLDIVDETKATGNAIKLTVVGKNDAGNKGFLGKLDGDDYVFMSGYANKYPDMIKEFLDTVFKVGVTGEVKLEDFTPETYANRVSYKEFGAVGDGVTDDSAAIKAAHDFANKGGQLVVAESNKTYYIPLCDTISIKTNVDFGGCKFIFDDTTVKGSTTKPVFSIDPDSPNSQISSGEFFDAVNADPDNDGVVIYGINHGDKQTTKLGNGLGYKALLTLYDSSSNMYIRWGYADGQNHTQEEIVVIEADGTIDPTTPFLIDYEKVTKIKVQNLEGVEPITVKNATVTTRATKIYKAGNITRNFVVNRPYTTIEGIKHKVEGEYDGVNIGMLSGEVRTPLKLDEKLGYYVPANNYTADRYNIYDASGNKYTGKDVVLMEGVTYTGILNISFSEGVTVKNCELQARMYYGSGTYDLNLYNANNVTFINVIQTNFFDETRSATTPNLTRCWGIMGSNYCKNLNFEGCRLTRFDAHCGVYNASMKNCDVALIRLIGGGEFTLDGTTFYFHSSGAPIQLREDYGATFNGTLTVKDCTLNSTLTTIAGLIDAPTANWDNGYDTYFPNLVIDNIKLGTAQTEFQLVIPSVESYVASGKGENHYPSRNILTENVHDPEALFTVYYETKTKDIVEKNPEKFPYLDGFKKVDKSPDVLKNGEYTVVDHADGTYTVIAKGAKNVRPYYPPEKIEIKNMKDFKNGKGQAVTLKLYNAAFFDDVEIIDADKVLKRAKYTAK